MGSAGYIEIPTTISVTDAAHVHMGNVSINSTNPTTTIDIGTDSEVNLVSLRACGSVDVSLTAPTARLEVDDYLRLGDDITIAAPTGGTVSLGGDFTYTHEEVTDVDLRYAHIECIGDSQLMEIGGTNFGPSWDSIPDGDGNFGYEQLTIGSGDSGHPTTVELVDLHDNHEAGESDVLYLFGIKDPNDPNQALEGLRILGGSTLIIGDLDVYARLDLDENGSVETEGNLRSLFGAGETIIPFNHNGNDGYISLTPVYCHGDLVEDRQVNLADLQMLLSHYGTTCFAEPSEGDLNGDGDVDLGDLQALLANYGTSCP